MENVLYVLLFCNGVPLIDFTLDLWVNEHMQFALLHQFKNVK